MLCSEYLSFINTLTGVSHKLAKNRRDNVYNISIYKEEAQIVIKHLYYPDCLCIDRKKSKAKDASLWQRPLSMKKVNSKSWDKNQDCYILEHSLEESSLFLERTTKSVKSRLWRLKNT